MALDSLHKKRRFNMERDTARTIVQYYGSDYKGVKCGYCKGETTNYSSGMWAHCMSVGDYQSLIYRGWRRSGQYCYKPSMNKTCCPQYPIRCNALEFKLSKSHKKVLKRMNRYLIHGTTKSNEDTEDTSFSKNNNTDVDMSPDTNMPCEFIEPKIKTTKDYSRLNQGLDKEFDKLKSDTTSASSNNEIFCTSYSPRSPSPEPRLETTQSKITSLNTTRKTPKPGIGADPTKGVCRKAKDIRRERKAAKLAASGAAPVEKMETPKSNNTPKTLEDFLNEPMPENAAHKLELRLVHVDMSEQEFKGTFDMASDLYSKYQIKIHNDHPVKGDFLMFLIDNPLVSWKPSRGPPRGYGAFHQQYWLDGKLIAVGVLDVLPHCISSVYLFYHPDYSFLSLGTYSSLRELALVRELQKYNEELKWYYMGFYIHSCPKMTYKSQYFPSYLLCPETYTWNEVAGCKPKLDLNQYSRFNQDKNVDDPNVDIKKIPVLYEEKALVRYGRISERCPNPLQDKLLEEYVKLVGNLALSMVVVLNS